MTQLLGNLLELIEKRHREFIKKFKIGGDAELALDQDNPDSDEISELMTMLDEHYHLASKITTFLINKGVKQGKVSYKKLKALNVKNMPSEKEFYDAAE